MLLKSINYPLFGKHNAIYKIMIKKGLKNYQQ